MEKTNYRLKMSHSIKQQEYVLWKYDILKDWILTEPKIYEKTKSITIRTISHPELTDLHAIFYRDKKKIIPQNIEELLSPLALAVWFMDDGNIVRRNDKIIGLHLNTQSFTLREHKRLQDILNNTYKISTTIEINNGYYRLAIWKKLPRERFVGIVKPYILDSMCYKIG